MAQITIRPLSGSLGAEITGVDLSDDLDNATAADLHQAFVDHQAVFFPDQRLGPADMLRYVSRLGDPLVHPYLQSLDGFPAIHELRKTPDERVNFGNIWHTDFTNLEHPSLANALYAIETPDCGGDTLIMSMYEAYEALSPGMKALLDPLMAVHGRPASYQQALADQSKRDSTVTRGDEAGEQYGADVEAEVLHPVVRRHPETGRRALYVNPGFTLRFEGMSEAESQPMLDFLYRHCERPEFGFRYSWRPQTLGIWDNRCTMHYASNDYQGKLRVMHRMVVLESERPVGIERRG